jgi:hypothetical protein
MVNHLKKFTINNISKNLNKINIQISLSHNKPFPNLSLLSHYSFKKRFVKIFPNGGIQGGYAKMIISLIDFSFVRSLVAHRYSVLGPPCYDPVSLFLLDLFRYIDGYPNMKQFLSALWDENRGRGYRTYAGISMDNIPCEGTFSYFRSMHIGETLYNEIFHVLVKIFHELEMITFNILCHDGTLYPSWARYKGCCYFCGQCKCIRVNDVIQKVKDRILYRLENLSKGNLGKECRVYTECQSERFPDDVKRPKIELFAFRLSFCDGEPTQEQRNTASLFGVEKELEKQHLCISTLRSNVTYVDPTDGSMTIRCPKLPKDTDARIGVRKDTKNPDRKQKVFGYNAVLSTSVEMHLGIELPVAVSNIAGNADEADLLVENTDQIYLHHECKAKIAIADSKYDAIKNYAYLRANGSIPIVDYNPRNENLSKDTLVKRGYDQNGWPFAPCGLLCRPNGFDAQRERLTFCCFKQCLKLKFKAIQDINSHYDMRSCPGLKNHSGFARHMFVKEHPRLVNEIPRGSKQYKQLRMLRSASERLNSSLKEDLKILDRPRVLNIERANILAQMAAIVLLLKRAFSFVVRITILMWRFYQDNDQTVIDKLIPRNIPNFIRNIIQLE